MNEQTLIELNRIDPNPFQVRLQEDPAAVAEVAASIGKLGLMQVPTARKVGDRYQLAFGHTRLAAFKKLQIDTALAGAGGSWTEMPLIVRELTDLQMFELAVAENIKRRDLNPIELARAMRTYMDPPFGKTSEEAGEFFGVSAETVRGTVRLLGLPEPIQDQVKSGAMTIGTARKLLSASRVMDPAEMKDLAQKLVKGDYLSDIPSGAAGLIEESLEDRMDIMWGDWNDDAKEEPRGGRNLWPLTWKHAGLPALPAPAVIGALQLKTKLKPRDIEAWIGQLAAGMDGVAPQILAKAEAEQIRLLFNPPACTDCPLYVKMDAKHYCGLKACWERKKRAWIEQEFHKVAAKLKIPMYDKTVDGAYRSPSWETRDAFKKLVKAKDPDLRLVPATEVYNEDEVTGSVYARVVDVKPSRVEATKAKAAPRSSVASWNSPAALAKRKREEEWRKQADKFCEQAVPVFACVFEGLTNIPVMEALANKKTKPELPKAKRLQILREHLAADALNSVMPAWGSLRASGPVAAAKKLEGVARTWGVKLPKDWMDRAKAMMPKAMPVPRGPGTGDGGSKPPRGRKAKRKGA